MERHWKYLLLLVWFAYLFISGIFLFTRGFLLNRETLPHKAVCETVNPLCNKTQNKYLYNNFSKGAEFNDLHTECTKQTWTGSAESVENQMTCKYSASKVVLIVIDALKFDFAFFDEKIPVGDAPPYKNKLTVINDLLTKDPNHTRLFKFIADPPTTTMQRLKGLTTGSLPTFIDVGSNFATPEINEDNILDQLKAQNKNIVFMGDDTWLGLYPKRFIREHSYPSFNVWDLDTVDNGIMNHLLREIVKKDWVLLIAHFLGVDHCGHRYGPNHPEMTRKLKEMNDMIRSVVDTIDDSTMLFVIGDHGMTNTGDHGGDSEAEVTAALFIYSPKPLLSINVSDIVKYSNTVNQIDLVPTLSTILAIPIPFSNLGTIILEALPSLNKEIYSDWEVALKIIWRNVKQTIEYMRQYSQRTNQFSKEKLSLLENKYNILKENKHLVSSFEEFVQFYMNSKAYLSQVREMCEEVWVQFDSILMTYGLIITFVSILFIFLIVDGIPSDLFTEILNGRFILIVYCSLFCAICGTLLCFLLGIVKSLEIPFYISTGLISMTIIIVITVRNWGAASSHLLSQRKMIDWPSIIGGILLLFSACGLFSNSYVVEEARVQSYFLVTLLWLLVYNFKPSKQELTGRVKMNEKQSSWFNKSLLTPLRLKLLIFVILFSVLMRLSQYYWFCREEQRDCESFVTNKAHSFATLLNLKYCNSRYLFTLICLALFATIARIWLRSCGNLVGFSPTIILARYCPTVIVVCTGGFWVLQTLPKDTKFKLFLPWQIQFLPWIIYIIVIIALVTMFIQPLSIYLVPKQKDKLKVPIYGQANIIPHLFNQMKELMKGKSKSNNGGYKGASKDLPIVYGLATVYSSVFVNIGLFVSLLVALLMGDVLAPSIVLMCTIATVLISVLSAIQYERVLFTVQLFNVPMSFVICWGFLTMYFFYGTGHNPTFPGIQWDAAFVGTGGQFSNHIVPALLIGINTFASHIILSLMLPILLISPVTLHVMFPKLLPSAVKDGVKAKDLRRGELFLYEKDDLIYQAAFNLCSKYILFFGIRIFACMLAATVHCRHLMVWKIFAPKFIFEGLGLFIILACVLISYLFIIRITVQIEKLLLQIEMEHR